MITQSPRLPAHYSNSCPCATRHSARCECKEGLLLGYKSPHPSCARWSVITSFGPPQERKEWENKTRPKDTFDGRNMFAVTRALQNTHSGTRTCSQLWVPVHTWHAVPLLQWRWWQSPLRLSKQMCTITQLYLLHKFLVRHQTEVGDHHIVGTRR
jgi:hypothetical protein